MVYIEKKGKGEYAYGWSKVGEDGRIVIPTETVKEYDIKNHEKVLLIPRHKLSGGFELTRVGMLTGLLGMERQAGRASHHSGEIQGNSGKTLLQKRTNYTCMSREKMDVCIVESWVNLLFWLRCTDN